MNEIALSLLAPTQPLDADQGVMSPMASSDQAPQLVTFGLAETSFPYRYTSMCATICSSTHSRADAAAAKQAQ
ncbi:hypothetical protein PHYSODRAFT_289203 [Phytophthora sojae]|uniref:Uncharacterized protein n=1 Tax=Phytophthora sojae (strain P6497) TaxID=1094619 RepID=G5AFG2_PHYSP|nr:hypothetical protein PHYSODRAFT_289203 [Phytophthora sojae]EGZ05952.1 hypothetical protein PHYSODRAFT_289203 [Phytophthora sojae]|eukprot:XP_009538813.1 hypothetical protein PHYSODRAFT_289203 [Phytophthora sojae]